MKPRYADRIGRLLPERKEKPLSAQALETLAIIALKQPVALGDINAIRGIESAGTVQTLRNRKLIARQARLAHGGRSCGGRSRCFWTPSVWPTLMSFTRRAGWKRSSRPSTAPSWRQRPGRTAGCGGNPRR